MIEIVVMVSGVVSGDGGWWKGGSDSGAGGRSVSGVGIMILHEHLATIFSKSRSYRSFLVDVITSDHLGF